MKVDPGIVRGENAMRAAIDGVIHRHESSMLDGFADLSTDEAAFAVSLARRVVLEILHEVRPEGMTREDYNELSHNIAEHGWVGYDAPTVRNFLEGLVAERHHPTGDVDALRLLLTCAGYLVGGLTEEDEEWEDYLDEVENRILFPDRGAESQSSQPR
ncbi:hypothetical protein CLV30_101511 [Haloactinopolyspora alba]|uniref:Uncharacterized protein n=1 Tax=Haloactinopolyspora alba TaxID=648780 RepID=A0A2P8EGD1_9ACTN|nr:hypothetical protein [Haloactinopolyspora alba]PSL08536.1 hypothetical protein CLV30_101511 [Haloactinopolyspora alba]